ncbi:hypothetical protein BAUCODRAFT_37351 [Baudoinia panamericana UAMH 10762]|uniref:Methyltransferase type 11 domain-containing protein n=1 Tax=Baudoinia panamericana (strain UAMH 10762) TaxID=717646 RepID=M2MQ97_BAUPA|nr:uncharacterized protein BAUCODRAFT_37351 [Baudoinia panamericana UAMH 10762]EMC93648.1 hypothetical protein BAUCODRAFT_37351 [Baudoinia panamericana UAMH 10762]
MAIDDVGLSNKQQAFKHEHGRRYRANDNAYFFPANEKEYNRLDLQHLSLRMLTDNKSALAPLPEGSLRVLDLGIWAKEFIDEYPQATVVGVDLSFPEGQGFEDERLERRVENSEAN